MRSAQPADSKRVHDMALHQGPSGEEWDEETDGPEPELSPLGSPFGDGIRVACKDSVIRNNVSVFLTTVSLR